MANETIIAPGNLGNFIVLESNGGSIANNSVVQADDANYNIANYGYFPKAKFAASFTFSVAPTEGTVLSLYARPLDIDGTADAEIPEASRPTVFIGNFIVNNVTTAQYSEIPEVIVPWNAAYYLHNNGTGQTVSAGWTLKVLPCTLKPAT